MRKLFLAAILSACALAVSARSVTHSLVLTVHPPFSADSLTPVNGGTTGRLVTIAGVWTFENFQHPSGNWSIQLNGTNQNPNTGDATSAVQLYVLNGGVLYQVTAGGIWYSWTGAGPWAGPVPDPRGPPPTTQAFAVSMTNGPPNIPNAAPCITTTCAWIGAGWPSGTHVSLVYADLTPISASYGGAFALFDQGGHTGDASHFSISTSSDGTRNVGEIKTSGTVAAGDYFIGVTATGAGGSNSQNVTVHAASGTTVACGAAIPTSGTVLLSPNCTYNSPTLTPSANTIYIGAGNGGTILDGGNSTCRFLDINQGYPATPPGWTVIGIQFQNFASGCPGGPITTADNDVIRNSRFVNDGSNAMSVIGQGNFIANNYVNSMGYAGIAVSADHNFTSGSTGQTTLIGNEVSNTNTGNNDPCNDVSATKIIPNYSVPPQYNLINNYYHDNAANDFWPDTTTQTGVISGNTLVRAGVAANQIEQSRNGTTIDHNVIVHSGDGSTRTNLSPPCGGETQVGPAIWIQGSANVNAHDNNISVFTVFDPILGGNKDGYAFYFFDETGNGTGFVGNNTIHDNTVNFFTTSSGAIWGWQDTAEDRSGSVSNNNHYHLIGGNTSTDQHWFWFNQGNTAQTFATYRNSGQEAASTIDTTDTSTTGCTHVACSGSGVGAGGVPLGGGPTPPPGAVAAGFTTLAANYDFTQSLPSNWIDCLPSDGQVHQFYMGNAFLSPTQPCSTVTQVTDPVYGGLALRLHWDNTLDPTVDGGIIIFMTISHDKTRFTDFPQNYYLEWRLRDDAVAPNDGSPQDSVWFYSTGTFLNSNNAPFEEDGYEYYGTTTQNYNGASFPNGNGFGWLGTNALPRALDITTYNTWAMRMTANVPSLLANGCSYLYDANLTPVLINNPCKNHNNYPALNNRNILIVNHGPASVANAGQINNFNQYIRYIRLWSCANWRTTQCPGTPLLSGPP